MFRFLDISRGIALLVGVMAIGSAQATVIAGTDFIKTASAHYVINATGSSAIYRPSFIVIGADGSEPSENFGPFSISGSFDVERYQSTASPTSTPASGEITNKILFTNANITLNGATHSFEFPSFFSVMTSDTAFQSEPESLGCSVPSGLIASCVTNPSLNPSFWSGTLSNQSISIDGFAAVDTIRAGYNYHIEASPVPLPGAVWLFASALGLLGGMTQRRNGGK
ncbi:MULTISPECIES: VPLPA-CTERM sorting domain-containing protein [Methylomonas]|uniref:PEP-CTERM protein-sorting domain-containing protein n=2 Tax=Methylomonas TaxID=416 RepID=A0A126T6F8_9GAMM|nr:MULTISPECIES: VPLPA-CTERM sorting domain-containing protein [Methylomonas]AMK77656.1 hypothetical protein JT25_014410 [Methylomonas denitrificans]OAH96849.1 hypothetical protein A1342_18160 [Methylomonas methanica]TCV86826.1 hypothetical protein EDE11_10347 [Methylomonas methanica]